MKILLCTAPMVQVNTPYPATAYLKGFLDESPEAAGVVAVQADPALELVLRLFSPEGLRRLRKAIGKTKVPELQFFLEAYADYARTVPVAIAYLQGKATTSAPASGRATHEAKIAARDFFPEGPRFQSLTGPLLKQFKKLSVAEKAQHVASLFLDDLADYVKLGADPRFEFSRYGEKLSASSPSFDPLLGELTSPPTLVDEILAEITKELLDQHQPDLLCLSVPFAGTVYGAFRMGEIAKGRQIPVALGGGYCNTELRRVNDPRVFDYVDYITLDDGERPLLGLIAHLRGPSSTTAATALITAPHLFRTFTRDPQTNLVTFHAGAPGTKDIPFPETGTPSYEGLPVHDYISLFEMLNPVTKLWSGFFWNKLTLAHGCYWHRCSFCDTSLDYIGRYETEKASRLVDRMEKIIAQTGRPGFHFVDEAAPPAILKALAEEIIRRELKVEWWGNIRFDKAFTPELCVLLKKSGCLAVTGGLEVASPRILKLIDKGVTLEQVARVTQGFQKAGIFVHAYLMYGFPTQTVQETVDSLEVVRQLFRAGCLQSAFWHRFAATVHSPVGKNPEKYGIRLVSPNPALARGSANTSGRTLASAHFSENDLPFEDPTGVDHDTLGLGLKKALYNYMHGIGLDFDLRDWFPVPVPKPAIPATFISTFL